MLINDESLNEVYFFLSKLLNYYNCKKKLLRNHTVLSVILDDSSLYYKREQIKKTNFENLK